MKMEDFTHTVQLTLTYDEAESMLADLWDSDFGSGDNQELKELIEKLDEYVNT